MSIPLPTCFFSDSFPTTRRTGAQSSVLLSAEPSWSTTWPARVWELVRAGLPERLVKGNRRRHVALSTYILKGRRTGGCKARFFDAAFGECIERLLVGDLCCINRTPPLVPNRLLASVCWPLFQILPLGVCCSLLIGRPWSTVATSSSQSTGRN